MREQGLQRGRGKAGVRIGDQVYGKQYQQQMRLEMMPPGYLEGLKSPKEKGCDLQRYSVPFHTHEERNSIQALQELDQCAAPPRYC